MIKNGQLAFPIRILKFLVETHLVGKVIFRRLRFLEVTKRTVCLTYTWSSISTNKEVRYFSVSQAGLAINSIEEIHKTREITPKSNSFNTNSCKNELQLIN
jgi:hypothetical protein